MVSALRYEFLAPADQEPLSGKLGKAGPGYVVKFWRFVLGAFLVLAYLASMVGKHQPDAMLLANITHLPQQGTLNEQVRGIVSGHTQVSGIDDQDFASRVLNQVLQSGQMSDIIERRQEIGPAQIADGRKLKAHRLADSPRGLLEGRQARFAA